MIAGSPLVDRYGEQRASWIDVSVAQPGGGTINGRPQNGHHTLTPRIVVADLDGAVQFLRTVFDGSGEVEAGRPAEIHIGDSVVMVSSTGERDLFPAFL